MVGKNNQYVQKIKQGTKVETYSIKKFKVGIASVAIGCSVFFGAGVAMAGEQISGEQAVAEATISKDTLKTESKPNTETVTEKQPTTTKVEHNATQPNAISEEKETEKPKAVVNTKKLEDLLSEIDKLNLSNYTEESVKALQEKVAQAKEVLTNAKTQKEIDSSYNALVSYKNSGLKRVPKLKEGETPKPDTTNGKETLGKKAGNTEPNGTNIAGRNHSMNRTSLPEGSGFREASTELTDVQMGLTSGAGFSPSNVRVTPPNNGYIGKSLQVKIVSTGDIITKVEVSGNTGFPLNPVTAGINTKSATVSFNGNTPSSGQWLITVTAYTDKGKKSYTFGAYTPIKKPTIESITPAPASETQNSNKPTVKIRVEENLNTPPGTKFRAYLVRNGGEDGIYAQDGLGYPRGYEVIATADVGADGIATIEPKDYVNSARGIGSGMVKAMTILELSGKTNDTDPGERGSWFSSEMSANPAPVVDKNGAIAEIDAAKAAKDAAIDSNVNITNKNAAKAATKAAADAAKAEINKADTNTDAKVTAAKDAGVLAINKAKAITEIKAALEAKEKATDEDKSLTKGQKTSIKEIAKKEAMAATVKIKEATTNKEVEEAKNEGIEKIKAAYAKNAELAAELTLPKLIITKWEDEEGNELRPADAKAPAVLGEANEAFEHGEFAGYVFVKTETKDDVVTHIFRKVTPTKPEGTTKPEGNGEQQADNKPTPTDKADKAEKTIKRLANTGMTETNTGLAGLGLSVLGAVLMTARQRRKNK